MRSASPPPNSSGILQRMSAAIAAPLRPTAQVQPTPSAPSASRTRVPGARRRGSTTAF
jgi:hypothetical protein